MPALTVWCYGTPLGATAGSVRLGGDDVTKRSATRRARLGLSRSFQTSALFDGLTADSPDAHVASAAPGFPVFRVDPA